MTKITKLTFIIFCFFQCLALGQVNLECRDTYTRFFDKDEIIISVFLGYNESQIYALDGLQKTYIIQELTKKCGPNAHHCGFSKENSTGDVLSKTIVGPDLKVKKIVIKIKNPSLTDKDAVNTQAKNKTLQSEKSKKTEDEFMSSLTSDDVVFYLGHSRYGAGPGFRPLEKNSWDELTRNKLSLNRMIETLQNSSQKPKMIAMLACNSENAYGKILSELAPGTALVLTKQLTTFEDGERILLYNIDALLGFKCKNEYQKRMSLATSYFYKTPVSENKTFAEMLPQIHGFFEPITQFSEALSPDAQFALNIKAVQILFPPAKRNDAEVIHFQRKK